MRRARGATINLLSALALSVPACGGNTESSGGSGGGASAGGATAGNTSGGSASGGAGATGGSASGGAGAIGEVTLSDAVAYSNCQPGVQGDPIIAFWEASVSGAVGHATATLLDATLSVNGARTLVQHLTVDHPSFPLTNGAGSVDQRKVGADVPPGNSVCLDFCMHATWSLELEFDVGRASASGNFECPS